MYGLFLWWLLLCVSTQTTTFSSLNENQFYLSLYLHIVLLTVCSLCDCRYSTPRLFPDDCVSVFDSEACEYIVHKRGDPTVLCPIYGAVGK